MLPLWPIFVVIALAFTVVAVFARASPAFLASRAASMALTLFTASLVIFFLIEIAPGDPAAFMMGLNADPAAVDALREELGLNQSLIARYASWIGGLAMGDFGVSYTYRTPVAELMARYSSS